MAASDALLGSHRSRMHAITALHTCLHGKHVSWQTGLTLKLATADAGPVQMHAQCFSDQKQGHAHHWAGYPSGSAPWQLAPRMLGSVVPAIGSASLL
eukprot:5933272-Amphidinium_carterae.1